MTWVYTVPDISCAHCKDAIEGAVSQVSGVSRAEVTVATKTVEVDGDAADADIRAAIEAAGYDIAEVTRR
jgi:copper chaperone CopZ